MSEKKSNSVRVGGPVVGQGEIMDYMVVYSKDMNSYTSSLSSSSQNRNKLQRQIGRAMKNGWQPFGSVSVGTTGKNSDTLAFAQAMVKYE